ncbi:MAG: hypothetical protein KF726_28070 [Anaerolineae bacterium]|nr:hypothetical protein [Anaerolineae bacterium]
MRRFLLIVLLLISCIFSAQVSSAQTDDENASTFFGHWAYQFNAPIKLNSFLNDGWPGALGIYADLVEPPLAYFRWSTYQDYEGLLATKWNFEDDGSRFVVTLRDDAQWSDGSPLTARDLVVTYLIGRLRGIQDYRYVDTVTAQDDHTVVFTFKRSTLFAERLILKTRVRPASVYGAIADKVQALLDTNDNLKRFDSGELQSTAEWKALQDEINEFRPQQVVSSGPYTLDPADVMATHVTLHRSETSAFKPTFDNIMIYRGNADKILPRIQSGEITIDYSGDQYSPDIEPALEEMGYQILRTPTYSGAALYFNHDRYTLGKVEVRQALAYLLDRKLIAEASLADSAEPVNLISGLSEDRQGFYLTERRRFDAYEPDTAKAEAMFTALGFTKNSRGAWLDDQGEPIAFHLTFPAEVPRYPQAAAEIARQLTEFGISVRVDGVTSTQLLRDVVDGRFDLLLYTYGVIGNPFPFLTYRNTFYSLNEPGLSQGKKGIAFPLTQTVDGEQFDLAALTASLEDEQSNEGATADAVGQIAYVYNKLLPILPLYERHTNTPLLVTKLSGVPSSDDPIYKNAYTADNYVILWLLEGTIAPK